MVDVDKAVIARLKKDGLDFEIMVDSDTAFLVKQGKAKVEDALATNEIYRDVKKGLKASEQELFDAFGSNNVLEVAETIIKEGDIQLTTELRNKIREEKLKRLIDLIHRNAIDSRTGLPHPYDRIERAIEQKRVRIDETKPAEQQLHEVVKQINDILPLKFELRELSVKIPANFAGKAYGVIKGLVNVLKSDWQSDGSLLMLVELPAGLQPEFEDKVNKIAQGNADIKIVNRR